MACSHQVLNPKNGKPHTVRLYSIASSRYGDDMSGQTLRCVSAARLTGTLKWARRIRPKKCMFQLSVR